jgi:hypothetical protein
MDKLPAPREAGVGSLERADMNMYRIPTPVRVTLLVLLVPLAAACAPSTVATPTPVSPALDAAAAITAAGVGHEVQALAHDSTRGRDTPSPELEKAALYLEHRFRELGLEPAGENGTYVQRWDYDVVALDREATAIRIQGQEVLAPTYEADFFLVPGFQTDTEARAHYVGVAGDVRSVPGAARGAFMVFDLPGSEVNREWQQRLDAALQPAMAGGPAGIIFVLDPEFPRDILTQLAGPTAGQQAPFPLIGIAHEAARDLFDAAGVDLAAARADGAPSALGDVVVEVTVARTRETHRPPNVVGVRRGSDPSLRDTYVVVTAHFDHLGVGNPDEAGDSIYNGADDNASGTAALLEMARATMALPEAPARSILFLAVSGEEKGLLGSRAFVESPTVPLSGIVANINLDMVGRNHPDTVIAIGQEYSTLENVIRRVADRPGLGLEVIEDPEPEKMFFFRSDQLSFVQRGIPAVFFTTGDHPDYHQQSDRPERIDNDKLARVARLAFHLAYEIAMDPAPPEWTEAGWREVETMLQGMAF